MENSSNAVIMAGSILLFLMALSVAVFLYNRIMSVNDSILTTSENNDRTAEGYTALDFTENEKLFTGAEIANQILELTRAPNSATTDDPARKPFDYKYYQIFVDGVPYTRNQDILNLYSQTLSTQLNAIANPRRLYRKSQESYTTNGVVVRYTFVGNKNV
ncbi:MAG: hypothetical protein IKR04_07080 [Clostridia bacterium]|nr:hypothetical protein [Clostridia bacterium]